jgi:hypothetical protein
VEPDAGEEAGDDGRGRQPDELEESPGAQRLRTTTSAVSRRPPTATMRG